MIPVSVADEGVGTPPPPPFPSLCLDTPWLAICIPPHLPQLEEAQRALSDKEVELASVDTRVAALTGEVSKEDIARWGGAGVD